MTREAERALPRALTGNLQQMCEYGVSLSGGGAGGGGRNRIQS